MTELQEADYYIYTTSIGQTTERISNKKRLSDAEWKKLDEIERKASERFLKRLTS